MCRRPRRTRTPTPIRNGFLTLLSDGERLTGAYALGPRPASGCSRRRWPSALMCRLDVLSDTIQPFPSFSGIYDAAVKACGWRSPTCHGQRVRCTPRWRACRPEEEKRMSSAATAGAAGRDRSWTARLSCSSAAAPASGSRPRDSRSPRARMSSSPRRNPDRLAQAAAELGVDRTAAFDASDTAAMAQFFAGLPGPVDHVLVTAGGPKYGPLLEMTADDLRDHPQRARDPGAQRRAQRRPDAARRHAAAHGRHRRPPGAARQRHRPRGDGLAAAVRGRAGAGARAGPGQPHRGRLRGHPAVGVAARRPA